MAADLAWNIESIPERAREQALRSARKEGVPIGEWMTRQIFEGLADSGRKDENNPSFEHGQKPRGAVLERAEEPERNSGAVHRLQQDIGRLGREINDTARRSDAHISALADGLEELTQDLARLRADASIANSDLQERLAQTAGQLTVQLSGFASKLESLAAESRSEQARALDAAKAVEQRLMHTEQTVQALAAHRDDTARTVAAALEALVRQFDSAKDLTSRLDQRLGVVEHSLDWLGTVHKNEIHELSARISAVDGRFDDVSRGAQDNADRLHAHMASLQAEFGQLTDFQQQESQTRSEALEALDARLEQLRAKTTDGERTFDSRLDEMQQSLTDLNLRQDQAAADAEVKFSHLDADVASKLESTARLLTLQQQTAFGALASRHSELENALNDGLHELKQQAARSEESHSARHNALQANVAEVTDQLAQNDRSAADQFTALAARFDELDRATSDADQRIETIRQLAAEQHARSHELAGEVERLVDRIASSDERLAETTARHADLAAEIRNAVDGLVRQSATTQAAHAERLTALDGGLAELRGQHAEAHRSVADRISDLSGRLDELHGSTSSAAESADQRIENLQQFASELERRHADRSEALAHEVQNLTERLASSEERFVDKARYSEFAAELAGKIEALEHLVRAVDGNVADVNRTRADTDRSVAQRIAGFAARIDDLQLSTSHAAAAAQQRFETLEQCADDEACRNKDRVQALMHDVQSAIDRLASSEERFTEANTRQQSSIAELTEKFQQRQNLDANQADIAQRASQEIAELRRDIGAKLALLEPPLANLQHIMQQSDLRHETQERLLGEKLEELASRLAQIDAGVERRLGAAQDEVDHWHDNYTALTAALQALEAEIQSHASKLADLAQLQLGAAGEAGEGADHLSPSTIPVQSDPGLIVGPVDSDAEQETEHPVETAPEIIAQAETEHAAVVRDDMRGPQADAPGMAAPDTAVLDWDDPADLLADIIPSEEALEGLPPFPELPPPSAVEANGDRGHDGELHVMPGRDAEGESASQEDRQPAADSQDDTQSRRADVGPVAPQPSFISQARQAAQMAAQNREVSVGKVVQKTRFSVVAAVTVVVLSIAGARLWLARTSMPAPRASTTGNAHILNHARHAISTPSQSASAVASSRANADPLLARASAGDVRAQLLLGVHAFDAPPSPQGDKDAFTWLSRAAKQGNPVAQCYLAMLYRKGRGVAADARQAFNLYSASASAGNRLAMNNLAVAYAQGVGVNKDVRQAALWFSEAADRGLIEAQFDLAVLYERGLGVPQSLSDAYRWYTIAARAGDSESKARAEAIATELSPAERDAADQDAAQFKPLGVTQKANALPRDTD